MPARGHPPAANLARGRQAVATLCKRRLRLNGRLGASRAILAHMLTRESGNYLIAGGRQIGKSSLLKAIDRHYRGDPLVACHYLVLTGADDLVGPLARGHGLPLVLGDDARPQGQAMPEDELSGRRVRSASAHGSFGLPLPPLAQRGDG